MVEFADAGPRMYSLQSFDGVPAKAYRRLSLGDGNVSSMGEVIPPKKNSYFFIKKSFESLNYDRITNQLELEIQKANKLSTIKLHDCLRIGIFLLAGALTGLLGVFLELAVYYLGRIKFSTIEQLNIHKSNGSFDLFRNTKEVLEFVGGRALGVFVPVMIGGMLVTFIAPYAAGGGVAQAIAYLNGVRVPNVLSIKGLVIKSLSTIFTVISGLSAGKEGPMMHMGAIIGGSLPSLFCVSKFQHEHERRDFAAAGFGAGLAVVFGAPIGGLLIALEEGVSFLDIGLMWKIYLCCVFGYAINAIVISLVLEGTFKVHNSKLLSLGYISSEVTHYRFFELVPFSIVALIGGLIGVLLIKMHVFVVLFRDRYVKTKTRKMIACFVAACIIVFFQVSTISMIRNCSPMLKEHMTYHKDHNSTYCPHRLYCPENEYSDMSMLYSKTQGDVLRMFFGPDVIQVSSLGIYAVIYFILFCITVCLPISGGIFIPQIMLGAAWGRLFGVCLNKLANDAKWARPAKYAYLGAAAQLSGTVGKTFSILVIFVEASGSVSLSFPLMVIVSITRCVCTFFVLPIYETQMHLIGLPFLPQRPPPVDCDIPSTKVMSEPPLITLLTNPTVASIIDNLKGNSHNGYPVVGPSGDLVGLMLRQQLVILLKYEAYKYPSPVTSQQMCECHETYVRESRTQLDEQQVIDSVAQDFYDVVVDLSPYYNLFPSTVTNDTPMVKAYELFRGLGIRHLVVINRSYIPVGIITRKDLAKFHTYEHYCLLKVKIMPERS